MHCSPKPSFHLECTGRSSVLISGGSKLALECTGRSSVSAFGGSKLALARVVMNS